MTIPSVPCQLRFSEVIFLRTSSRPMYPSYPERLETGVSRVALSNAVLGISLGFLPHRMVAADFLEVFQQLQEEIVMAECGAVAHEDQHAFRSGQRYIQAA